MTCPQCASPLWMTAEGNKHFRCGSQVDLKTGATSKGCRVIQAANIGQVEIGNIQSRVLPIVAPRTFSHPVAVPVGNGVMLRVAESNGDVYETPMIRVQAVREK
jgi:hypothetical protein